MKNEVILIMAVVLCGLSFFAVPAQAKYGGGTGEPNDPYLIYTAEQMNEIGLSVNWDDWDKHFKLMADIDLAGLTGTSFNIIGTWQPRHPFTGVFDGSGHTISNFTYTSPGTSWIGLFGEVAGENAIIKDLGLIDPDVDAGTGSNVGALVARLYNGTITNCYAQGGSVAGDDHVGGLVGANWGGTITNCYATSSVSGDEGIGGLVGTNFGGTITNCYATGSVSGVWWVAGLVGYNLSGTITNCYSESSVSGNERVGGLMGYNSSDGTITNSYSTGRVSGSIKVGGLVGRNGGTITKCYSTGSVSGDDRVGGLVGRNAGTISNCYSSSSVTGTSSIGGLVGYNYEGAITNCYSTGSASGHEHVGGLAGENEKGTITNSYSTGSVTGNYGVGGLVGWNYRGTINNCYSQGDVSGKGTVGGLVGYNYDGTVTNCYSTASVSGTINVGGLVGQNGRCYSWGGCYPGTISNCYSRSSVSGDERVGGLVGYNELGTISASFWDIETGGPDNGIGTPLPTEHMQMTITFTNAGWDFVGETFNGIEDIWFIREGLDYPHLRWENHIPVADAGLDQAVYAWIDGIAEVTLDGTGSYDEDNQPLTYLWSWTVDGNTLTTTEPNVTIELPVGEYIIQLIVNDGIDDSEPDEVVVTVVSPMESHLRVAPRVINRHSHQPAILAMLRLPEGVTGDEIDSNELLVLYPGGIEAEIQRVIESRRQGASIFAFFDKGELMAAVPDDGSVELQVVGELATGQYFYGTDTVWIIGRRRMPRRSLRGRNSSSITLGR